MNAKKATVVASAKIAGKIAQTNSMANPNIRACSTLLATTKIVY